MRLLGYLKRSEMYNLEIHSAGLYIKGIKFGNLINTGVGEACSCYLKLENHLNIRLKSEE